MTDETIKELDQLLFEISQVFDGWHADVAWSVYDESVRKRITEFRIKYTYQLSDKQKEELNNIINNESKTDKLIQSMGKIDRNLLNEHYNL